MEPLQNPYDAPQLPLAHLVPAAGPGDFVPGELPCHRCGQPVPPRANRCPACAARPLYDRVQLWLMAILMFALWIVMMVWQLISGTQETLPGNWLIVIIATLAIWIGMHALFKKLRGGKW